MAQNNGFDISRREILAGLGTIGVASAGAGLGTTAYFSDSEDFEGNSLTAGELDLKVDWEEHYSDWSDDEAEGIETVAMEQMDGLVGFPSAADPTNQSVFVSDPDRFLANTAIEAFPDIVDEGDAYDAQKERFEDDSEICDLPADTDSGQGVLSHPFRTGVSLDGGYTAGGPPNPQTTEAGDPLIQIDDVKPGDFGEVTFSFHLCGNPGYVWLTGELVSASENGYTEPEIKDPDESGEPGDDPANDTDIELLDEIRVAFWYDTGEDGVYGADYEDKDDGEGDNYHDANEVFVPLMGSLRNVLQMLESGRVPLDFAPTPTNDGDDGNGGTGGTTGDFDVCTSASDAIYQLLSADLGIDTARNIDCEELDELLVSNGYVEDGTEYVGTKLEANGAGSILAGSYTAGNGKTITVESIDIDAGTVTLSTNFPVEAVSMKGGQSGEKEYIFEDQGGTEDDGIDEQYGCILDNVTFQTPENNNGVLAAISNIEVCYDPMIPDGNGGGGPVGDPDRDCFPNSTTAYIGFEWWLPVDHANEIQTDSVSFDLGFYTEQCRHNDGSGQQGGTTRTVTTGDGFGKSELSDGEPAWFARSRWGSGDTSGTWELGVGDDSDNLTSSNVTNTQYDWNGAVPFSVSYDGGAQEATITVDGTSVTRAVDESPATGDFVVSVKSDSNIDGSSTSASGLTLNGSSLPISSLSATTSGGSRENRYLLAEGFDFGDGDTLAGTVELDDNGGSPGEEGLVVDVYVD